MIINVLNVNIQREKKKMKVRKLLELQSTIEERKVPSDMNGELNKHYEANLLLT